MISGFGRATSSGAFSLRTANAGTSGVTGGLSFSTGDSTKGTSGHVVLKSGDADSGPGGSVSIVVGVGAPRPV